jgi:hypothetical protein
MTNLRRIKKGDTYTWDLKFYTDSTKQTTVDVSGHTFLFTAINASGATIISLDNAAFTQQDDHHRRLVISSAITSGYGVGELKYQLDVTLPDATVSTWMEGFIRVEL